jgi:HEAT repeat protein
VAVALQDSSSEVRHSAAIALRSLGWRPSNDEEQAMFEVAIGNTRAASFKGEAAVNPLVGELGHTTDSMRRAAAEALEGVDDPRRIQPLLAAAADPEPTVRVSAIHALGKVSGEQVTRALVKALRDPDSHVRLAAAIVLGRHDNPEHVPQFLRLLEDTYFEVRLTAVQFLGRMRQPQTVAPLLPRLNDKDSDVRLDTAKALGEIRSPEAIEALVVALIDDEHAVRHAAEMALSWIDRNWVKSEAAQRGCAALQNSMNHRPAWVRAAASQVIARLRPESADGTAESEGGGFKMAAQ